MTNFKTQYAILVMINQHLFWVLIQFILYILGKKSFTSLRIPYIAAMMVAVHCSGGIWTCAFEKTVDSKFKLFHYASNWECIAKIRKDWVKKIYIQIWKLNNLWHFCIEFGLYPDGQSSRKVPKASVKVFVLMKPILVWSSNQSYCFHGFLHSLAFLLPLYKKKMSKLSKHQ